MRTISQSSPWHYLPWLWLLPGLLLSACQSLPQWPAGQVFKTRGYQLTYRAEHFAVAGSQPFLVDTVIITAYGKRLPLLDPNARGEDTIRQWSIAYRYGARGATLGARAPWKTTRRCGFTRPATAGIKF